MQIGSIQIINETEIDGWGMEFRIKNKKEDRGAEGRERRGGKGTGTGGERNPLHSRSY